MIRQAVIESLGRINREPYSQAGRGAARLLRSLVVALEAMLSIFILIKLSFSRSWAVLTW